MWGCIGIPLQSWLQAVIYVSLHLRFSSANFDSQVASTSKLIHTSLTVLLDPENVGVAFGILLLSCLKAEIYVMVYAFPVYGGHLWFITSRRSCYFQQHWKHGWHVQRVECPRKFRGCHWNVDDTLSASQVNVQCTSDLAAAVLDLSLPVTSDSNDSMIDMSTELNDLENIG